MAKDMKNEAGFIFSELGPQGVLLESIRYNDDDYGKSKMSIGRAAIVLFTHFHILKVIE